MGAQNMRIQGWEAELRNYIESSRNLVFSWGENDCCLWAGRFADIITDKNNVAEWFGYYSTEEEANEVMGLRGFKYPYEIINTYLPKQQVSMAGRGDLVMNAQGCIGICDGRKSYFLSKSDGLVSFNTNECKRAWKV